jgi:WhiB family transcriptional regulator, redox-sensing transcriptional regulator
MTSTIPNLPLADEAGGTVAPVKLPLHGACWDEDPELFFPVGSTGPALLQIEDAKEVCRRCDVVEACLRWALETGQDAGVWGGMSEDERRAIRKRARSRGSAA